MIPSLTSIFTLIIDCAIAGLSALVAEMITEGSGHYIFTVYLMFALYNRSKIWYSFICSYLNDPDGTEKWLRDTFKENKGQENK